jgi:hypothetical protein
MVSDANHGVVVGRSVLQVWHGTETMGLVDDSSGYNLIASSVVLQASVDMCGFHVGIGFGITDMPAGSSTFIIGQKGACRATLSLTASRFGDGDFEEQIIGGDWGGEQALGERVIRAQRY